MTANPAVGPARPATPGAQPLSSVTVLDLTRFMPGPLAAQMLGDLGANVIKIEGFPGGDIVRAMEPIAFGSLNRNKKSLHVDFQTARGREVLGRLIAGADVFMEVSRPGSMAAHGLDYDGVRAQRADIIYCSVSAYGQTGPYVNIPSHGFNMDGLAGLLEVRVAADGSPFIAESHINVSSLLAAHAVAMGISAALFRRVQTGQGVYIDASCWDCAIAGDPATNTLAINGGAPVAGFASRKTPKYAPYRTLDGRYLMVCAIEKKFWRRLCELLERADLIDAFDGPAGDDRAGPDVWGQKLAWVYDEVARVIATRDLPDWEATFEAAGLPITPVKTRYEALSGENAVARGILIEASDASGRAYKTTASGLVMDGQRGAFRLPAPSLGEHTDEILTKLDYSAGEIARLRADRVVG